MHKNIELDKIEDIACKFLKAAPSNKYRDHFFPHLINELDLQVGVEIGTDKGGFASKLLEKSKLAKLHCVDPWIDDFGSDYRPDFFNKDGDVRLNEAAAQLKTYIDQGRCFFHRGFSADVAQEWTSEIDYLYIDGGHNLSNIYIDLHSWVPKVRIGGIVSGHDFKDGPNSGIKDFSGKQLPYRVKTVVEDFCQEFGFKLCVVGGVVLNWWFVRN